MYVVYLFAISLIIGLLASAMTDLGMTESLLKASLFVSGGLGAGWAFMGHVFASDKVAGYIGWPKGNPFQKEVGFANLGFAVVCLLSPFFGLQFAAAAIAGHTVFLWGAALVHVREQQKSGNFAPGNAGPVFYADILIPVWQISLFAMA